MVLVAQLHPDVDARLAGGDRFGAARQRRERRSDQIAHGRRLDAPGGGDDEISRRVRAGEVVAKRRGVQRSDRLGGAENRASERMIRPEVGREHLVHEVVRRVLDHLDLFEDNVLLAADLLVGEGRIQQQVAQQIDGPREMLVKHLDVVAGVLLRGERIELPADRVDLLCDGLRGARGGPLEQHVLHEVRDAGAAGALVPGAPGQPGPKADRAHAGHRLREQTKATIEIVPLDHVGGRLRRAVEEAM